MPLSAFLIYHHDDLDAVERFVDRFGNLFAAVHTRGVTDGDDFVTSLSDHEIIHSIRERYIRDASLAIVLLGKATWSRRFVDWEIAAAIGEHDDLALPLLLIDLDPQSRNQIPLPPRLTNGGPMAACRVDPTQSRRALAGAVAHARARASTCAPARRPQSDPLLRRDLH